MCSVNCSGISSEDTSAYFYESGFMLQDGQFGLLTSLFLRSLYQSLTSLKLNTAAWGV